MNCGGCGSSNPAGARFCANCGAKLFATCPDCGAENSADSALCHRCGRALESGASSVRGGPAARETLEPVLRSRTMLEGERKEVTVVFADITGSSQFVAGVDPEQAMARLDGAVRAMTAAARRYGGVDRPQGDGIMVLFGAPLADQDHAIRGCLAALAMQKAVAALDENVAIRVGVHSGPVVVRSIRTGLSVDFDAIGETVHLAARMEQAAEPGKIRITEATYRLAKDFIRADPLGAQPVKGLAKEIGQYELVDRTSLRTLWDARAASRLTPLVDREAEFAALRRAAADTLAGSGRMVLISGDAGSGKSRLVHEFLQEFRTDAWIVLRSGAMPFSLNAPYAMPAMLLASWLGLDEHDAIPAARLREAAGDWGGRWGYAALATVLGLPVDDVEWQALDPDARRRHTHDALAKWIASLSRDRALILVFEDMQWADSESAGIVAMLARRAAELRLLIVATQRSGDANELAVPPDAIPLRVDALPLSAAREMVIHLVGGDPGLSPVRELLVEKTGGVPLFLEETTRALSETGAFDGHGQGVKLDDIRVPSNVRLVLASRIDRLPPAEKELLQVASVMGVEAPVELLRQVADLSKGEMQLRVDALEAAGFLRTVPGRLLFAHILTRDAAHESLLMSRRRALHRRVVDALERSGEEALHLLAHHAVHGELWAKAVHYLLQAANRAVELSAYVEAVELFEEALKALRQLPATPESLARGIDVRLALRAVLGATLDFPRIGQFLAEAKAMAVEIDDDRRLAAVAISEAMMHNQRGDCQDAIEAARLAHNVAERLDDETLLIPARIYLGQAHLWRGEIAETSRALSVALDWTSGPFRHRRLGTTGASSILCLGALAAAKGFAGQFAEAEKFAIEATAIAGEVERPYDSALAAWYRGRVLSYQGRMAEALEILDEAYRLSEVMEVRYLIPPLAMLIGFALTETGRLAEGADLLARAGAAQKARTLLVGEVWCSAYLGSAKLRAGELQRAAELGAEVLASASTHGYAILEVMAHRLLGAAKGRLASVAEADQHLDRAIARAEALGLRPELAHCRLERGLLMKELARPDAARDELERAAALYAEMGMGLWHARAAAALDEIGRPVRQ
jgi:class 3 adenylate cyclase/tetratricopeptide (TPR) repeat protein